MWITFCGLGARREVMVVVVSWVEWNLNPHPFKNERVRHPKAGGIGTMWETAWVGGVAASNCGLTGGRGIRQPCRRDLG